MHPRSRIQLAHSRNRRALAQLRADAHSHSDASGPLYDLNSHLPYAAGRAVTLAMKIGFSER